MMFYEKEYKNGNIKVFLRFLYEDMSLYDESFIITEHIESILKYDADYTMKVNNFVSEFGYHIKLDEPYFVGSGTTGIVYIIYKKDTRHVAKYIWGGKKNNYKLYNGDIIGQNLLKPILKEYIVNFYEKKYYGDSGLIIMDYVEGEILNKVTLNEKQLSIVINELFNVRNTLLKNNIQYYDINDENILIKTSNDSIKITLIDYDDVTKVSNNTMINTEYIDDIISNLQNKFRKSL